MFLKRMISLLLVLLLVTVFSSSALITVATAEAMNNTLQKVESLPGVSLRYSYTASITTGLTFSGNAAYCMGSVKPIGSYNVSLTVTLYKQNGSSWNYITSWSGSSTGGNEATASGSTSVSSGTYKVTTYGNIGNGLEYPTATVTKTK